MADKLQGKRIAFLVAPEGTEQVELTEPWDAVLREGATAELVSTGLKSPVQLAFRLGVRCLVIDLSEPKMGTRKVRIFLQDFLILTDRLGVLLILRVGLRLQRME